MGSKMSADIEPFAVLQKDHVSHVNSSLWGSPREVNSCTTLCVSGVVLQQPEYRQLYVLDIYPACFLRGSKWGSDLKKAQTHTSLKVRDAGPG